MGGDQAGGLAIAIGIVMLLIIAGCGFLLWLIARFLTRNVSPKRRGAVTLLLTVAGLGIGWLAMMATFYESSFDPPPELRLATAPGFDAPWVVLLEDPRGQALEWRSSMLPFTATTAELNVPPSGIVRLRSFGPMEGRMDLTISWPDQPSAFGAGGGPGPPGSGASAYMLIANPSHEQAGSALSPDGPALAAYIAEREGRR
jgi:hypothetical protein